MLRLPVKVNGVNNLSDARYCAGMGVDMIGFSISENHPRYLPSDKINGITGWLSGVQIVAEGYFGEKIPQLTAKAETIQAGTIEIDAVMYKSLAITPVPFIYRLNISEWENLQSTLPADALLHVILQKDDVSYTTLIKEICESRRTFLNTSLLDLPYIERLLLQTKPHGITLDGGNELSPGVRDFEHLAEVLEYLEV